MKLFSLNDYLGLSTHPQVCLAAAKASAMHGMGAISVSPNGIYHQCFIAIAIFGQSACFLTMGVDSLAYVYLSPKQKDSAKPCAC